MLPSASYSSTVAAEVFSSVDEQRCPIESNATELVPLALDTATVLDGRLQDTVLGARGVADPVSFVTEIALPAGS